MRAVAKVRPESGAMQVIEVDDPRPAPGQVLIHPLGSGVCGTDVSFYHWYRPVVDSYGPTLPLIMGHEIAGTVTALGEGVADLEPGRLVAVNPHTNCGKCFYCVSGRYVLCENRRIMGCHINGGWAEQVVAPRENVHPLPEGIDPMAAALMEPLTVAVHSVVDRVPVTVGDTVLVMGTGPMGLLHLLAARAVGARTVLVAGLEADRERLRLAEELGGLPLYAEREPVPRAVRRMNPRGADVAFDTTGDAEALHASLASLRKGGRLGMVGFSHGKTPFDTLPMVLDELDLIGCRAYNRDTWPRSVGVMEVVAPQVRRLVTHVLPFTEIDEAIRLIERRECVKVVLQPDA